mmetsp:Transcript_26591/g.63016  ORF Transcript_26591/g.63016 Transcript_26591/m.63016 type:complete len:215 (-) Transcript_26591:452-1096(-)
MTACVLTNLRQGRKSATSALVGHPKGSALEVFGCLEGLLHTCHLPGDRWGEGEGVHATGRELGHVRGALDAGNKDPHAAPRNLRDPLHSDALLLCGRGAHREAHPAEVGGRVLRANGRGGDRLVRRVDARHRDTDPSADELRRRLEPWLGHGDFDDHLFPVILAAGGRKGQACIHHSIHGPTPCLRLELVSTELESGIRACSQGLNGTSYASTL